MNMEHYEEECIITFLNNQEKLLKERVAETQEEAAEFLEDCFAVVLNSVSEIRSYWEENGMDIEGMSDEDILEAAEVFELPSGRFMVVEA